MSTFVLIAIIILILILLILINTPLSMYKKVPINKALIVFGFGERKVIKGDGRGSSIGIPTANLEGTENLCLKEGVYSVLVDDSLLGVANYGYRPTFDGRKKVLEVHIIDFKGDIRGKKIKVEFLRFIREERKFNSPTELKKQIEEDITLTKNLLNEREPIH